jgi:hypothetical protein
MATKLAAGNLCVTSSSARTFKIVAHVRPGHMVQFDSFARRYDYRAFSENLIQLAQSTAEICAELSLPDRIGRRSM